MCSDVFFEKRVVAEFNRVASTGRGIEEDLHSLFQQIGVIGRSTDGNESTNVLGGSARAGFLNVV